MPKRRLSSFLALAVLAGAAAAQGDWRNVTAGGPLRPGVYGRIEVRGGEPPPVIYSQPQRGSGGLVAAGTRPVYLYVPPGQVRKWPQHCARWQACDQAVLFVRVESPSRWGSWRQLRDQVALHGAAARE